MGFLLINQFVYAEVTFPEKPASGVYVFDGTKKLSTKIITEINQKAQQVYNQTNVPVYVVAIKSLKIYQAEALGIDSFTKNLFGHWQIGFEGAGSRGILFLYSKKNRKSRIEFGTI